MMQDHTSVHTTSTGNNTSDTVWGGAFGGNPLQLPGAASDRDYDFDKWDEFTAKKERDKNMRRLYRITVVNPKTEEVLPSTLVVAKDEAQALLKADLGPEIRTNADQYDLCIEIVGDVRAKKETQKVKVVKEEEE